MLKSHMTWYTLPRPIVARCYDSGEQEETTLIAFAFDGDDILWLNYHGEFVHMIFTDRFAE